MLIQPPPPSVPGTPPILLSMPPAQTKRASETDGEGFRHERLMPFEDAFEIAIARFGLAHESAMHRLRAEMLGLYDRGPENPCGCPCAPTETGTLHRAESPATMATHLLPEFWKSPDVNDDSPFTSQEVAEQQSPTEPTGASTCTDSASKATRLNSTQSIKLAFSTPIESEATSYTLAKAVQSAWFDSGSAFLILCNTVIIAVEAQWKGTLKGAEVMFNDYGDPQWHSAKEVFDGFEFAFGTLFAVECVLKASVQRVKFVKDPWNLMDFAIVFAWFFSLFSGAILVYANPVLLRLIRMVRLLRLIRLVRSMRSLESLFIITTSIKGSISILFWTLAILVPVLMFCALVLQAACESYVSSDAAVARREEVFAFYGTFARSFLTMFEITLGNWMPPCRALVDNVSEWFMLFFVLHKLVIGFSVLAVVNGVFMQETFRVASHDDHVMLLRRENEKRIFTEKMRALFNHLDDDGDGDVSFDEFHSVADDANVVTWLSAMELEVRDVEKVFQLIDTDGSGRLKFTELARGISKLKGQARSIDLATLAFEVRAHWKSEIGNFNQLDGCGPDGWLTDACQFQGPGSVNLS